MKSKNCCIWFFIFTLCAGCIYINTPVHAAEPVLIRFSHVVGENTPKGAGARLFQQLVEKRLGGRVVVEVYPRSQKFTDGQALLGLLFGDIEMAAPSFPKFRKFSRQGVASTC